MVYISEKNWNKILGYADIAYRTHKSEIGGMSVMIEDQDGDWELKNPVILKQEKSSGNTVLDKDSLAEYYTRECKKMGKKNFRICWWHSHHTMAAFWSGTDLTAIDEFEEGDFSFALVVNLKGEYKFRISVWRPLEVHQDVELEIMYNSKASKKMEQEVKDLCEKPTISWKQNTYNNYKRGYGYQSSDQMSLLGNGAVDLTGQDDDKLKNQQKFADILHIIDTTVDELIDGTIKHTDYAETLQELNKELRKEDSVYHVIIVSENKQEEMLYSQPSDYIVYFKNKSEKVVQSIYSYDDMGYGWDVEDRLYNQSYGGKSNGSKL